MDDAQKPEWIEVGLWVVRLDEIVAVKYKPKSAADRAVANIHVRGIAPIDLYDDRAEEFVAFLKTWNVVKIGQDGAD